MIIVALGFFSLAAILGLILLSFVLRNKHTPKGFLISHGMLAAIGVVLLISYIVTSAPPRPVESLVLFIIAAAGGATMGYRDITGKSVPKWLAITHGLIAISGFISLVIYRFNSVL
jgi:hypothetical protein